jgi:hypothetical protein
MRPRCIKIFLSIQFYRRIYFYFQNIKFFLSHSSYLIIQEKSFYASPILRMHQVFKFSHLPASSDKIGETMFHGLILVGRLLNQVSLHVSDKKQIKMSKNTPSRK